MYSLKKDLILGNVLWAKRNIYYDRPDQLLMGKKSMYVVTMVNDDYFFGCPLTTNPSIKNSTVLSAKYYPIKSDSRITECLYRLDQSDIISPMQFSLSPRTFEHFKRSLYKKIILGAADSPDEYNEIYVQEYLKENVPSIGNILVYTSEEKKFRYYYIYDENEENYIGVQLDQDKRDYSYSVISKDLVELPKTMRFFDYFTIHSLNCEDVVEALNAKVFVKSIECYPKK